MDAMGRSDDRSFCSIIRPFLDQDEGFYFQAASFAMARLNCPGAVNDFMKRMQMTKTERKEEKFASLLESRDWQMEERLQERRNSIMALKFFGSAAPGKKLMEIVLDPDDDQELRREAASSLAYCADEEVMGKIRSAETTVGTKRPIDARIKRTMSAIAKAEQRQTLLLHRLEVD